MIALDLRSIARALGGEVSGGQVLCPGPGHRRKDDRSLTVRPSASAPLGVIVYSHAGDPFDVCQRHVAEQLGLDPDAWKKNNARRPVPTPRRQAAQPAEAERTAAAIALWRASTDPRVPIVQQYLTRRKLELGEDLAGEVIRWNERIGAMVALFRNIVTDEPQAVSRTYLDTEGQKLERKFLGPTAGAAIKLDPDNSVLAGLHVAEGVETALTARQLGLKPAWALGSAGAIAAFPILSGVECLTLLAEHDDASQRAVETCAARWHAAGREVLINEPIGGKDLNDAIRRRE